MYYGVGKVQGNVNNMSISIKDISLTIDQYDKVVGFSLLKVVFIIPNYQI